VDFEKECLFLAQVTVLVAAGARVRNTVLHADSQGSRFFCLMVPPPRIPWTPALVSLLVLGDEDPGGKS
jgi:hypothetical protein